MAGGAVDAGAAAEGDCVWRHAFRERAMHEMLLLLPLRERLACRSCCRDWRRDISATPALFRRLELGSYRVVDDAALQALLAWSCPQQGKPGEDGEGGAAAGGGRGANEALRGSELQYLDATGCTRLTGAGVAAALGQRGCPALRCLKLGGVSLSLNALRSIFAACPALEEMEVDLEGMRLPAAKELAALMAGDAQNRASVAVRTLRIRPARINMGINGAAALGAALKTNWRLQTLCLAETNLRPEGITSIAAALTTPSACALRMLDLSKNSMGDAGAFALASALPEARSLWELRAAENELSQSACWAVAAAALAAQNMRVLDLRGNDGHYADKVVREIAQALASGLQAVGASAAAQGGAGDGAGAGAALPASRLLGLPPPLMVLDGVPIRAIVDNTIGSTLELTPEALARPVRADSRLRLLQKTASWLPQKPAVPLSTMRQALDLAEVLAAALSVNTSLTRLDMSRVWSSDAKMKTVEDMLTALDAVATAADANPGLHLREVVLGTTDSQLAKEQRLAFWPAALPRYVIRDGVGVPVGALDPGELAERVTGALCSYAAQRGKAPHGRPAERDDAARTVTSSSSAISGLLGIARNAAHASDGGGSAFLGSAAAGEIAPAALAALAALANGRRWCRRLESDAMAMGSGVFFSQAGNAGDGAAESGAANASASTAGRADESAAAVALGGVLASAVARVGTSSGETGAIGALPSLEETLDTCLAASDSLTDALAPLAGIDMPEAAAAREFRMDGINEKSVAAVWGVPREPWHGEACAATGGPLSFHMAEAAARGCGVALAVLIAKGADALGDGEDLRRLARVVVMALAGMCKSALRNKPLAVQAGLDVLRLVPRLLEHAPAREALLSHAGLAHLLARLCLTLHASLPSLAAATRSEDKPGEEASLAAKKTVPKDGAGGKGKGRGKSKDKDVAATTTTVVLGPQAMGVYEAERACRTALAALCSRPEFVGACRALHGCPALTRHGAELLACRVRAGEGAGRAAIAADAALDALEEAWMAAAAAAEKGNAAMLPTKPPEAKDGGSAEGASSLPDSGGAGSLLSDDEWGPSDGEDEDGLLHSGALSAADVGIGSDAIGGGLGALLSGTALPPPL